ncbi:MAG: hypothetical protein KAV18_00970, partial [Candidatus Omnitrophica bacterium]|nr:hypothetical protein [Candidatus Omnitrophota bacterium]
MTKKMRCEKAKGGVTAPAGFKANAVYCGIKKAYPGQSRKKTQKDLALICSEVPAVTAGFFTTNQIYSFSSR